MKRFLLAPLLAVAVALPAWAKYDGPLIETETLEGEHPPIAERIPQEPLIVDLEARGRTPGKHGGTISMFVSRSKDVRYMAVWGYARLVGYNEKYELVPDILKDFEISEDGNAITFHLRKGHRWSNGDPFTTEDFRYWWEDVALNEELSPSGPPVEMLVEGKTPVVTVIDNVTIRYEWHKPNANLLPALAQARPIYIYRPAKFMKKYHAAYADPAKLAERVEKSSKKTWAALHNRKDNLYKFDNPKLPILQPWVNTRKKNSQRYILVRNPYFHRIDSNGRQLPYVDKIDLEIAASALIPLTVSTGKASLQIRSLTFSNAPALKKNEAAHGYTTHLWRSGAANEVALYPNLNYADPAWRALFRDVRFRRALSIAISRKAINKVLFYGLAKPRAVAALEESPFFNEDDATAHTTFDLAEANRLLDELGLVERTGNGIRRLPDGRPMEIYVETAGERPEVEDTLEIIAATWREVGIRLLVKPQDRDVLRNRAYAGRTMMVAWYGWNVGIPTPAMAPKELAPVDQANFTWPKWGQYHQTKGSAGEEPDIPEAKELLELYEAWGRAKNDAERTAAWQKMLSIHAQQLFCIGTVARAPVPMIHAANLKNVPTTGIYAWDPGGQLGVHRMDEFYFDGADTE